MFRELSDLLDKAERLGLLKRNLVRQKRGRPRIVIELTEREGFSDIEDLGPLQRQEETCIEH